MKHKLALTVVCFIAATATPAAAQFKLPVLIPLRGSQAAPPPPATPGLMPVQGALVAAAGSDTVYFSRGGFSLDANAAATLTAQARWLLANPMVSVRLEGHGGPLDSRDYALAIGDRRANAVRDYLILQGVAPQRITVLSWGKERPGTVRVGTSVVAVGPRVITVIAPPPAMPSPVIQ
jgi:peptidoglycan-associated lipoprotein